MCRNNIIKTMFLLFLSAIILLWAQYFYLQLCVFIVSVSGKGSNDVLNNWEHIIIFYIIHEHL